MFPFKALLLLSFCLLTGAFITGIDDALDLLVPTTKSSNPVCRNHSIFYLEELKKLKLWATEMFDASSKFPSGVLSGSVYDFGNFDECVEVNVPLDKKSNSFSGRYCMAKFHVAPPNHMENGRKFSYHLNTSAWEKILDFSNDRGRLSRNDFHFSYCIPSSCQYNDLESTLQTVVATLNSLSDFKVSVTVDPKNCQTKEPLTFTLCDISFIVIVGIIVIIVLSATCYDWLIKLKELQGYKLQGKKHQVFIAFSAWTNLKKLAKETESDDRLECINGLKVFSMFFIIMGHRIMFGIGSPILNSNYIESLYGRVETMVLLNGPIIVDTFFNISGFLACYLLLLQFDRWNKKFNFLTLYFHRFLRLTPAYAVVLGFYCTIFIKTGSGPFWLERVGVEQQRCINSWWSNLIYLNNYVNKDQICMFQSWYMTCDMHLFLTTPLIVWLLRKKPIAGLATLFAMVLLSICVVFAVVFINNEDGILLLYMKLLRDPVVNNTFKNVYIPTHMRASPYFVGMITGYLKYKMRANFYKIPRYMIYMGWIMCIFIIEVTVYFAFIFYIPEKPYNPLVSAIYASMHHFTWSLCISWMIIAISEGCGSWVEPILAWKPLGLLSKITYTAFLCHGAIQIYTAAVLRQPNYASIFCLIFNSVADITLSYFAGFVLSMFFEAPIIRLEKILLGKEKVKPKEEPQTPSIIIPKIKLVSQL